MKQIFAWRVTSNQSGGQERGKYLGRAVFQVAQDACLGKCYWWDAWVHVMVEGVSSGAETFNEC